MHRKYLTMDLIQLGHDIEEQKDLIQDLKKQIKGFQAELKEKLQLLSERMRTENKQELKINKKIYRIETQENLIVE